MTEFNLVVRSFHCDSYGHVNNARYLEFMEEARWAYLSEARHQDFFSSRNLIFLVVNVNIRYRFPASPDDELVVSTRIAEFGNASVTFRQEIFNTTNNRMSAEAEVKFVLFNTKENKSQKLDEKIIETFKMLDGES